MKYLGFKGELTKSGIRNLRRASFKFITTTFTEELKVKFSEAGFTDVTVKCREVENHDQDPEVIEIYYPKLTETDAYLKPGLLIEIGSRSLREPFSQRTFSTFVSENYNERAFADKPITVPVVNPERTFLEKIFLLHELFQKASEIKPKERLSRHLYDIEKLSQTSYALTAFQDSELYNTIVAHRKHFTPVTGVDYKKLNPQDIKFIPPDEVIPLWENDYKQMRENMIYGESLTFADLINKLSELQVKINGIKWS